MYVQKLLSGRKSKTSIHYRFPLENLVAGGGRGGLENRKEHNKLLGGIDISAELCNLEKSSRVKTGSRECSRQAEEQVHKVADANGNSSMLLEWICKGDDQS